MRRVTWVGIVIHSGRATCEVVGVGHRVPVCRPVRLGTALDLAASGVPTVVRRSGG
jgi:hypothetical protein